MHRQPVDSTQPTKQTVVIFANSCAERKEANAAGAKTHCVGMGKNYEVSSEPSDSS